MMIHQGTPAMTSSLPTQTLWWMLFGSAVHVSLSTAWGEMNRIRSALSPFLVGEMDQGALLAAVLRPSRL